jgi:uncharacterized protein (TIGR02268 family)
LPTVLSSLLVLAILRGSPVVQPIAASCQEVQRVELSRAHGVSREICVSPGLLTGFVFDTSVVVDLEDEIRFTEVTRGHTGISVMPPENSVEGDRLRLTARFLDGGAIVTFVLVVHPGEATRQVEVYRDKRSRESFQHEVAQERARSQQLQRELERLQHQLEQLRGESEDPAGLRRLIASRSITEQGIRALKIHPEVRGDSGGSVSLAPSVVTYRSNNRVAVAVWLTNASDTPWLAIEASFVNARGKVLTGIRLWQQGGPIHQHKTKLVVVEADAESGEPHGEVTLRLLEDGPRAINISRVVFPP